MLLNNAVLNGYTAAATELIPKFESISQSQLFAPILHLFPTSRALIADIGVGTGAGAAWLAEMARVAGLQLIFECFAESQHSDNRAAGVTWTWMAFVSVTTPV